MTGRRLYECVTDALHSEAAHRESSYNGDTKYNRNSFQFEQVVAIRVNEDGSEQAQVVAVQPPAWGFLRHYEKAAWNAAAKRLSGRRR